MATEVRGESEQGSGIGAPTTDLISVGMQLARLEQMENFVKGGVYPRYRLAADLVNAGREVRIEAEKLGSKKVSALTAAIAKERDFMEKEPKKAVETYERIKKLRGQRKPLADAVKEGTAVHRENKTFIRAELRLKDSEVKLGLQQLGYTI